MAPHGWQDVDTVDKTDLSRWIFGHRHCLENGQTAAADRLAIVFSDPDDTGSVRKLILEFEPLSRFQPFKIHRELRRCIR